MRVVVVVVVFVVVVVVGKQFVDQLLDLLLSCSPTLNFLRGGIRGLFDQISLRGGIRGSLTRFFFGVGSVTQKSDFSLGWDPSMAGSLCNSV